MAEGEELFRRGTGMNRDPRAWSCKQVYRNGAKAVMAAPGIAVNGAGMEEGWGTGWGEGGPDVLYQGALTSRDGCS